MPLRRTSILSLFLHNIPLVTGCHPIVLGGLQRVPRCPTYANVIGNPANSIDACESRLPGAVVDIQSWHAYDFEVPFFAILAQPRTSLRSPVMLPAHLHGVVRRAICSVTACSGCCAWKTTPHCGEQKRIAWNGDVAICGGRDDSHHASRNDELRQLDRAGVRTKDREKLAILSCARKAETTCDTRIE